MCVDKEHDFGVDVVIAAADGCECPGRWCEPGWFPAGEEVPVPRPTRLPFPTVNDTVRYQAGDA